MNQFYNKYKYQIINLVAHIMFAAYAIAFSGYLMFGLIIGWLITNLFHYLYMHRIYTHRHFDVASWLHKIGLFVFSMINLGSPPVYAAVHMKHHAKSGSEEDPHNPYTLGFFRTMLSLWNEKFSPDRRVFSKLLADTTSRWFHDYHSVIAWMSALFTPFIIVVGFWMSKIVVVLVHIKWIGYGSTHNNDTSRNVWWLKPFTWGEELHNNHHLYAGRPNHNVNGSCKEFDFLYYIGRAISKKCKF